MGKLPGLGYVLTGYAETIEADFLRYYGVDLLDLYRGKTTLRRVAVLLRQLPAESNTARQIDESATWSTGDYLSAMVVDAMNTLVWLTGEINRGKGQKQPPPDPVPRPGANSTRRSSASARRVDAAELATWLDQGG